MLNRILAVTALGLAVGLAACDQGGQEQAQTPKNQEQRTQGSSPGAQQGMTPSQEQQATPPSQSAPQSAPSQSPSGGSSGNQ